MGQQNPFFPEGHKNTWWITPLRFYIHKSFSSLSIASPTDLGKTLAYT